MQLAFDDLLVSLNHKSLLDLVSHLTVCFLFHGKSFGCYTGKNFYQIGTSVFMKLNKIKGFAILTLMA